MLNLPDVTLLVIHGGVATELLKLALIETLEQICPARVLIFTSAPREWDFLDFEVVEIPPCRSAREAMRFYWYLAPPMIKTKFMMHVEWDGWVLDSGRWRDEFLDYDYIGAPWPWYADAFKVGNGLGIRSTRLMKHLASSFELPEREDHGICRVYRPQLEADGFTFAPLEVAEKFSWERGPRLGFTFMFHGVFNWPEVMSETALDYRIALADRYVKSKPEWKELGLGS